MGAFRVLTDNCLIGMPPAWVDPCNGHFTHELVRGKCPIEIAAANRVVNGGRRTAAVGGILPSSLQDAVSTSDLAYLNTVDHTTDVGFDFGNATIQELFDAAKSGCGCGFPSSTPCYRLGHADLTHRSLLRATRRAL